jgi:hypothetical protein
VTPAHPLDGVMTQQRRAFDELRSLLRGRTVSLESGIYAVGRHCAARVSLRLDDQDQLELRALILAFQPELVRWSEQPLSVHGRGPDGALTLMPIAVRLDDVGQGACRLPHGDRVDRWEIRTPLSAAPASTGMGDAAAWLPLRAGSAADTSEPRTSAWRPVASVSGVFIAESADGRVRATARYVPAGVEIAFDTDASGAGLAVRWVIGRNGAVELPGTVLPLRPDPDGGDRQFTDPIRLDLAFDRQLYFELVERDADA